MAVYRRAGKLYERSLELWLERGEVLTTPLLPDLQLPLVKIFED